MSCLRALYDQQLSEHVQLSIYLLDDCSSDGTSGAVSASYPDVKLLEGNGSMFWNGGMRTAFSAAVEDGHDFYLWVNDDTEFFDDSIARLLETYDAISVDSQLKPVIVGSTCNDDLVTTTYGGMSVTNKLRPLNLQLVKAGTEPIQCDTMNGNCVLIPQQVVDTIGILDPAYRHYLGDNDYGLRANKAGHKVWVIPGFVGVCEKSSETRRAVQSKSFRQALEELKSPKGFAANDADLMPIDEWKVFCRRYAGLFWPVYWLAPYRRLVKLLFSRSS